MTSPGLVPHPADTADRYRTCGAWPDRTVAEQWQDIAENCPERDAVVAPDGRRTYRELAERSDRIASGLLDLGLTPGDRVLFQVTNTAVTADAWYGVLKAGLVPVCTLAAHRHHEIGDIGRRAGAAAHLVEASPKFDMPGFAAEIATQVPTMRVLLTTGCAEDSAGMRIEDLALAGDAAAARTRVAAIQDGIDPSDLAVLQLSGGTTGTPKLIPRLHHEYWYNAREYARALGWTEDVKVAHLLPIIHNAGVVCGLHGPHSVGGCAVLLPPLPQVFLPAFAREQVTDVIALGALASFTAAMIESGTGLQRVILSGAKPPAGMFEQLDAAGIWAGQLYGMAEGFFAVTPLDAPRAARRWSVGVPISALDDVLILEPGTEQEVPDGTIGELCVRGPYTIRGYYDAAVHNQRAFTSTGHYRTGDLGKARVDDGYPGYSVEGRIKDVIDRGGEKISVDEIESLLAGHPQIQEAAVIAMPDPRLGQRACAYLVPHLGASVDLASVRTYLAGRGVAKYKWPERVEVVGALPRTPVGKIDKKALREEIAQPTVPATAP